MNPPQGRSMWVQEQETMQAHPPAASLLLLRQRVCSASSTRRQAGCRQRLTQSRQEECVVWSRCTADGSSPSPPDGHAPADAPAAVRDAGAAVAAAAAADERSSWRQHKDSSWAAAWGCTGCCSLAAGSWDALVMRERQWARGDGQREGGWLDGVEGAGQAAGKRGKTERQPAILPQRFCS